MGRVAAAIKIAQQEAFVELWEEQVRRPGGDRQTHRCSRCINAFRPRSAKALWRQSTASFALAHQHGAERMRQEQAAATTMIAAAAALGRWEELELAVDIKIAQQEAFVEVWEAKVRSQGDARKKSPPGGFLSVPALQRQTGISPQQVSRWRISTALERLADYRERIIEAAMVAA